MKKKVIIIGAGPAGITAGYTLLKKSQDYEVTILESSQDIGGISKTVKYNGYRMDIGGHRFFSKSEEVMQFWKDIMPIQGKPSIDDKKLGRTKKLVDNGPDPEKEDRVLLIRNRISRIYYNGKFFDYPITLKMSLFKNMGFLNTIKSGFSYMKAFVFKKKETSLENFYINRFGYQLYQMFFCKYTEKVWGRHPRNISADWGAQRAKGLSVFAVIKDYLQKVFHIRSNHVETSLIEEYLYPKLGPGDLWEKAANDFINMGGTILKGHCVEKVKISGNKIKAVICDVGGKKVVIKGDIFISSMPLKDLVASFDIKVPKTIKRISDNLPYRDFITVGILVDKVNLKNQTNIKTLGNVIPDCWLYIQEPSVRLGRIQIFNNWSPYLLKDPENTVWLGLEYFCNENDDMWNQTDSDFTKFAEDELIKMKIINNNSVLDSHVERVKKAYPAYFDTYSEIDKLIDYLNQFDNLYCIGRNGQHRYNNMDHSMMTAFETVDNIITGNKDRSNIWNVNVEKEYHEQK